MLYVINKLESKVSGLVQGHDFYHHSIAIARTCLALGSLITLTFNSPHYLFFPTFKTNPNQIFDLTRISIFYLSYPEHVYLGLILSIIILLCVIIGLYPRITCFLHFWVSFSIYNSAFIVEGGDQISSILTLLLIPMCIYDKRTNHWHDPIESGAGFGYLNAIFAHWIIRLQMAVVYLHASLGKLVVFEWANGTALYYWFTDHRFGMPDYLYPFLLPILESKFFLPLLTWGVIVLEFFLFLSFNFDNKWRKRWLIVGILFHFLIFIIHGLLSFFLAMSGGLILYLYPIKKN
jgi:antimicrobial peptide system SdpB family protein